MNAYREGILEEKGQTRETTERMRKIVNLAYLADHRISLLLLSADLILTF